jgi:hypothetical protein
MRTFITTLTLALVATPAFASHFAPDNSGLLCWGFLGFCALIIVAQVMPAIIMGSTILKEMVIPQTHKALE